MCFVRVLQKFGAHHYISNHHKFASSLFFHGLGLTNFTTLRTLIQYLHLFLSFYFSVYSETYPLKFPEGDYYGRSLSTCFCPYVSSHTLSISLKILTLSFHSRISLTLTVSHPPYSYISSSSSYFVSFSPGDQTVSRYSSSYTNQCTVFISFFSDED